MKHLFTKLLFIFLAVCFITGCRQPIGTLFDGGGGGAGDLSFMWVNPNRLLYETSDRFVRDQDLQILVAEDGVVKEIPPDDPRVTIEIIENPGLTSEAVTTVDTHFPFSLPGRHIVSVKYNEKSARYSVEVRGTYAGGGDGSDFVDIIWL